MNVPMAIIDRLLIVIAKCIQVLLKRLHLGSGSTWPGEIVVRLRPSIFRRLTQSRSFDVILVAGTNGKTTTSKMIVTVLSHGKRRVKRNESGANLDNGIISTFIADASWFGMIRSKYFIFEVDEATLPHILKHISPTILILMNLFRDQLDRYGEVDTIANKWQEAVTKLLRQTTLIINADDPHLAFIGMKSGLKTQYFGLENPKLYKLQMEHATDTIYCPRCGNRLTFGGVYFSHLGKWTCGKCGLTHPDVAVEAKDVLSPLEGTYNIYNTLAAVLTAKILGVDDEVIRNGLQHFTPAFGRLEELEYQGKTIKVLLSKNPTGCNESLRTIINSSKRGPLLLVLNDRIPDGTDVSWIWDVDFEMLEMYTHQIIISGDRAWDMGTRIKYLRNQILNIKNQKLEEVIIKDNLEKAIKNAVEITKEDETLWILPTYSAMLEVRKILTGKKIL